MNDKFAIDINEGNLDDINFEEVEQIFEAFPIFWKKQ